MAEQTNVANQATSCRDPKCTRFYAGSKVLCYSCTIKRVETYLRKELDSISLEGVDISLPVIGYLLGFRDGKEMVLAELSAIHHRIQNREVFID